MTAASTALGGNRQHKITVPFLRFQAEVESAMNSPAKAINLDRRVSRPSQTFCHSVAFIWGLMHRQRARGLTRAEGCWASAIARRARARVAEVGLSEQENPAQRNDRANQNQMPWNGEIRKWKSITRSSA